MKKIISKRFSKNLTTEKKKIIKAHTPKKVTAYDFL